MVGLYLLCGHITFTAVGMEDNTVYIRLPVGRVLAIAGAAPHYGYGKGRLCQVRTSPADKRIPRPYGIFKAERIAFNGISGSIAAYTAAVQCIRNRIFNGSPYGIKCVFALRAHSIIRAVGIHNFAVRFFRPADKSIAFASKRVSSKRRGFICFYALRRHFAPAAIGIENYGVCICLPHGGIFAVARTAHLNGYRKGRFRKPRTRPTDKSVTCARGRVKHNISTFNGICRWITLRAAVIQIILYGIFRCLPHGVKRIFLLCAHCKNCTVGIYGFTFCARRPASKGIASLFKGI